MKSRMLGELQGQLEMYADEIRSLNHTDNYYYEDPHNNKNNWGNKRITAPSNNQIEQIFKTNDPHKITNCVIEMARKLMRLKQEDKALALIHYAQRIKALTEEHCGSIPKLAFNNIKEIGHTVFNGFIKHPNPQDEPHTTGTIKGIKHNIAAFFKEKLSCAQELRDCEAEINEVLIERDKFRPIGLTGRK